MSKSGRLPYPGLRAFRRDEWDLFFGREGNVDTMVDRLAKTRFLAVLGPSGGGKSSLVRTGLLEALDLGYSPAGSAWCVADMRPGSQPMRNLAEALLGFGSAPADAVDIDMLASLLRRGPRSIAEWAANGNLPEGYSLLILVDQFEELFRYSDYAGREEAEGFVKLLIEASRTAELPLYVCITMRSEFLGACAMIPGLAEAINDGLYLTPRLSRDQCREAIVGPAGVCKFDVEPALVNKLLNDMAALAPWSETVADNPLQRLSQRADQLPLMQHVLNRMWLTASAAADDERPRLTKKDYDVLGGLKGALDSHGDEILAELGPARRITAERVFRALTTGVSLENAVRRPCRVDQLVAELQGDREGTLAVIEAFRAQTANFLQPPQPVPLDDRSVIDISHESLIRQWSTLSQWFVAEAQSAATWKDLLSSSARYAEGRGNLLGGLDLAQASAWWKQAQPTAEWAERHGGNYEGVRQYVWQSETERDREAVDSEQRVLRERKRLRIQLAASVAALVMVAGLGVGSLVLWRTTENQRANLEESKTALQTALNVSERQQASLAKQERLANWLRRREFLGRQAAEAATRQAQAASRAAEQASAQARASAEEARRSQREGRERIEAIGNIIAGNDSSFNLSPNEMRREIAKVLGHPIPANGVSTLSATVLRRGVAGELTLYLDHLAHSPRSLVDEDDRLANWLRMYEVNEGAGDIAAAARALDQAWTLARTMLESKGWARLSAEQRRRVLAIGYRMAWSGSDLGFPDQADRALLALQGIGHRYQPELPEVRNDPGLALTLGNYENLELALAKDRRFPIDLEGVSHHGGRALRYAWAAATPDASDAPSPDSGVPRQGYRGVTHDRLTTFTMNLARGQRAARFSSLAQDVCALSAQFLQEFPDDSRALRQASACAWVQVTENPASVEPLLRVIAMTSDALERDAENRPLRAIRATDSIGASNLLAALDESDDESRRLFEMAVEDLLKLVSTGFVAGQINQMDNIIYNVFDSPFMGDDRRRAVSLRLTASLEDVLRQLPNSTAFDEALARTLTETANVEWRAGDIGEAELLFRRAAQLYRHRRIEPAALNRNEVYRQCWQEAALITAQAERRLAPQAIQTGLEIERVCARYLDAHPTDVTIREEVRRSYAALLRLGLPDSMEIVQRASRFVARFGGPAWSPDPETSFTFVHSAFALGRPRPAVDRFTFRSWRDTERSAVADFLAFSNDDARVVGPESAVEFLRLAEAAARRTGRPFTEVARTAWEQAERELDLAGLSASVDELDLLYRRAGELVGADGAPVVAAGAPAASGEGG